MRSIGHPDFKYTPWSAERRAAASKAARERAKEATRTPIETEDAVNDASWHGVIER